MFTQSDIKVELKWNGGRAAIVNNSNGIFDYTGESLGQIGITDDILRIYRDDTNFEAYLNDIESHAIDSAAINNHDLTHIYLGYFQRAKITSNNATQDMEVSVSAMSGTILTGAGDDTLYIEMEDIVENGNVKWIIDTGAGDDELILQGDSEAGYTKINLGAGNDILVSGIYDGRSSYSYQNSKDLIFAGTGDDIVLAGAGDDKIYGESGYNLLFGGDGNDTIYSGLESGSLYGDAGNDRLYGSEESDYQEGGTGNDRLYGLGGNDELHGGEGDDDLRGNNGDDTLYGEEGLDKLFGHDGNDLIYGGTGNDIAHGGLGNDFIYGGTGNDRLYGNGENDEIHGGEGDDYIDGGNGNDILFGGDGNDKIYGGSGDDRLDGGAGSDFLYASYGNDILIGGEGSDRFYGSIGRDIFAFTNADGNWDYLYNYEIGFDIINITDVLEGYTHGVDDLNDFVRFVSGGANRTYMQFNTDGDSGGIFTTEAVIFINFTGQGADDLLANGTLVADISA